MTQSVRTIRDGLVVGIIGYTSVALLYALFDFFATRGFLYTVEYKTIKNENRDFDGRILSTLLLSKNAP